MHTFLHSEASLEDTLIPWKRKKQDFTSLTFLSASLYFLWLEVRENTFMSGRRPCFTLVGINLFYNNYFYQLTVISRNLFYLT